MLKRLVIATLLGLLVTACSAEKGSKRNNSSAPVATPDDPDGEEQENNNNKPVPTPAPQKDPGKDPKNDEVKKDVWATTSRRQGKILRLDGKASKQGGGWVQVSRLGNPLVNEVVIRMQDKDKFNYTEPKDDAANYANYVLNPQLAELLNLLYATDPADGGIANVINTIGTQNRSDLVAAFVTGIPGINAIVADNPDDQGSGDMIRVNTGLPVGWPVSGRQPSDDVVAAALQFLAQCRFLTGYGVDPVNSPNGFGLQGPLLQDANGNPILPDHINGADTINCALDDFVPADDDTPGGNGAARAEFPYIDLPFSSYGTAN